MMLHAQIPVETPAAGTTTQEFIQPLLDGVTGMASTLLAEHGSAFLIVAGIIAGLFLIRAASRAHTGPKDPTRLFSASQRKEGFDRAGGRCELAGRMMFSRCRRPAHHGDHWYPWSKGGSTSMANFVAACVKCNLAKGAKVPGAWQTMRLEARRRKYFAAGLNTKAGERFKQR